jgi:hypothetical protein
MYVHIPLRTGDPLHKCTVVQAVVTGSANSNCTLVTLSVLFEPVRFFELAVFPLTVWLCAFMDWHLYHSAFVLIMHLQAKLDSFIGAADEVSRVCAACS